MFQHRGDVPPLPETLQFIADASSEATALSFAKAFGGRTIYIPHTDHLGPDHPIAEAVGLDAAVAIARALRPGRLLIPKGPRGVADPDYVKLEESGASVAEIAKALGLHERTIFARRAQHRKRP